jgi:hypothetical protein
MIPKLWLGAALACAAHAGSVPGWYLSGDRSAAYEIGLDTETRHGGQSSAVLRCLAGKCPGFGTLMQTFTAGGYRDQRLRLSAWVKTKDAGRANIWMRIDTPSRKGAEIDDMSPRRASRGTSNWRKQEIVLDVPPAALVISIGLLLEGGGQAWVDDFKLEIRDKQGKTTDKIGAKHLVATLPLVPGVRLPPYPANQDFDDPGFVETK